MRLFWACLSLRSAVVADALAGTSQHAHGHRAGSTVLSAGGVPFFMHIPKNAGQAVEDAAWEQAGIRWGWYVTRGPDKVIMPDDHPCSWFHVPPDLLPKDKRLLYEGTDTFCISRHPYERAVAEYRWELALDPEVSEASHKMLSAGPPCTAEGLNAFLQLSAQVYLAGRRFLHDCHMLPQSDLIWGRTRQWCTNVLRIESLPSAFTDFANRRGFGNVSLTSEKRNSHAYLCPELSVLSLSTETLEILDLIYANDFRRLNYSRALADLQTGL